MAAAGRLQDRVAVITGGASGIGQATATRFAEEGAHVVIADLPAQSAGAEETMARVRSLGQRAQIVAIDVTEEAQVEEMADAAVAEFGRIDVLVAAAGLSHDPRGDLRPPLLELPTAAWQRLLDVNLTGVMLCNRAVAQRMIQSDIRGSIINLASAAARRTSPGMTTYSVTKIGVWMLTRGLALELAPYGIRVNAIGPGLIESPMTYRFLTVPKVWKREGGKRLWAVLDNRLMWPIPPCFWRLMSPAFTPEVFCIRTVAV